MVCKVCGSGLPENATFCYYCGNVIKPDQVNDNKKRHEVENYKFPAWAVVICSLRILETLICISIFLVPLFAAKTIGNYFELDNILNSRYSLDLKNSDSEVIEEEAVTEEENIEETEIEVLDGDDTYKYSYLYYESELRTLSNDYGKVNWFYEYPYSEELYDIVISITEPVQVDKNGDYTVAISITNLKDEPVSFVASGNFVSVDESESDSFIISARGLAAKDSYVTCFKYYFEPSPEIEWKNFLVDEAEKEPGAWEADWKIYGYDNDDDAMYFEYDIVNCSYKTEKFSDYCILLLDEDGNLTGTKIGLMDDLEPNKHIEKELIVFGDREKLTQTADAAMFTNPYL